MMVYFVRKGGTVTQQSYLSPPYEEANKLNSFDNEIKVNEWRVDGVILDFNKEVENIQNNIWELHKANRKLRDENERLQEEIRKLNLGG